MQKLSKKKCKIFIDFFNQRLPTIGAELTDSGPFGDPEYDGLLMCEYTLKTVVGALRLSVYDDWLACRFDNVEEAKKVLPHRGPASRLNPFSGKWNFHIWEVNPETPDMLWELFVGQLRKYRLVELAGKK